MIAVWTNILCELYVCMNSAITASDFLENGSIEPDIDYCQTFSNSYSRACGLLHLQRYDFQRQHRFLDRILLYHVFSCRKLYLTKYRNTFPFKKNSSAQDQI